MKKITRKAQMKFLNQYKTDESVLDIGAGYAPYKKLFPNRTSVDIDKSVNPDILADITKLPISENSYGTVLCIEIFEHLKDPYLAVKELNRIIKPGGRLIITTRFLYPLHMVPDDYWRYTPYIIRDIFKDWDIEKIEFESESFTALGILLQRLAMQSEIRGGKFTKAFVYLTAWVFTKLDWLIIKQYGEIERSNETKGVFTTGIYVSVRKR